MVIRVGINGFGRIGRQVFRAIEQGNYGHLFQVAAVNILSDTGVHLLKYDSTYGSFEGNLERTANGMLVDGRTVYGVEERNPEKLPWGDLGIDLVIEATGHFTDRQLAQKHIDAGARKVIITAPARNEDLTIVVGVNDHLYDPDRHHIVSNASCTTNAFAPVAKVVLEKFGIVHGTMTTIHAYTADQELVDAPHDDLRRARSAPMNIVPTSTGAARAVAHVIPELEGRFEGISMRVPTATVSVIDFVARLGTRATAADVNQAIYDASQCAPLEGILGISNEPLVSTDYLLDSRSSIVDGLLTQMTGEDMVKIVSWYDNEWAYSCRVADLAALICEKGISSPHSDTRFATTAMSLSS